MREPGIQKSLALDSGFDANGARFARTRRRRPGMTGESVANPINSPQI
jgi:hypothetical protein